MIRDLSSPARFQQSPARASASDAYARALRILIVGASVAIHQVLRPSQGIGGEDLHALPDEAGKNRTADSGETRARFLRREVARSSLEEWHLV